MSQSLEPTNHVSGHGDKRSYVRRADAQERLIDATIDLLRETPFALVTTRAIAERSGLNMSTIQTTFGSQLELYAAVTQRLVADVTTTLQENPGPPGFVQVFTHPSLLLRNRLVAWLLGEGVDPARFIISTKSAYFQTAANRQVGDGVDPLIASAFTAIVGFAMAGFNVLGETADLSPAEVSAAIELIAKFRELLPEISLGSTRASQLE